MIARAYCFLLKGRTLTKRRTCVLRGMRGFTLIELLVVLFILMLLAAVALPNVRRALMDQKTTRASRSLVSFIDVARSRAIAEGREIGVRFERLAIDAADDVGLGTSIRVRQLTGVPPYSGESADAKMVLSNALGASPPGVFPIDTATFVGDDHQLLLVSAAMIRAGTPELAPIRANVDRIELPGGKVVRINSIFFDPLDTTDTRVKIRFDLRDVSNAIARHPLGARPGMRERDDNGNPTNYLNEGKRVKYKIHRSPNPSSSITLSLPRGVVLDLNYSGIGPRGNQFIATAGNTSPVEIVFGPDGRVSRVGLPNGTTSEPSGQVFLCVGDIDGINPANLLENTGRNRGNLFREKSVWLVINQYSGRVFSSPIAPVSDAVLSSGLPQNDILANALQQSRTFATLADTVEGI